jgi:hypothetical protein
MSERPWNWCFKCRQPVDVDPESFDGSEHMCWGCQRYLTLVVYTDGSCGLYSERQQRAMVERGRRQSAGDA